MTKRISLAGLTLGNGTGADQPIEMPIPGRAEFLAPP
jgi:hypothetical protein